MARITKNGGVVERTVVRRELLRILQTKDVGGRVLSYRNGRA